MGKEGIIAEHPTLKLKYLDEGMARLALELKEKLEAEREKEGDGEAVDDNHWEGESIDPNTTMVTTTNHHDELRKPK